MFDTDDKATYFSAANPLQEHIFPNGNSLEPQKVAYHDKKSWDAMSRFGSSRA